MEKKDGPDRVTFIFADYGGFVYCQEPVKHRSVTVLLTAEQREKLALRFTHSNGQGAFYEEVSQCFAEPPVPMEGE